MQIVQGLVTSHAAGIVHRAKTAGRSHTRADGRPPMDWKMNFDQLARFRFVFSERFQADRFRLGQASETETTRRSSGQ
jgi:hypothetical protein